MSVNKEIIFAGSGGQGVLTAGLLMAEMALYKGLHSTWIPQYGSAMRGGTANCTVKFGPDYIFNPSQEAADVLLAMNEPSFKKFSPMVKPNGTIILNSDLVDPSICSRTDITLIAVPCTSMAKDLGHMLGANIIMAGVIVKATGDFTEEEALSGMNQVFRKKGKEKYEALNSAALRAGFGFV
ncbi:2-oxoacid:acceptor oxidoreductase family protein [Acidaminobacter hydrogenoformans]|uniref:2-oxoglutarate ferredoxin oxidoreductase subunit gamma n=1 Tax=Acidaminobacter hydrogenoformans DSM 2784 TaxID=1120920 RepID=A0A1G5S3A6_9FIRM|nr:2-oxoacid:acceptor oxidoreductase family protein [Acidaminobacter hydrogenoformans]SCZ80855.1 2-oxoglutarate ferredoxin oxidoreductase subunit gamma [Acidaminobacter hydrogenoformans DSM 2784]